MTSSRKIPQSGERPIVVESPPGENVSPERPPPERTTSAGPARPRSSSVVQHALPLLGAERQRRLAVVVAHEQRAALRAVVRRLRILEAALGAVDVTHEAGGEAFPARIALSASTSTCSSTLLPSVRAQPGDELGAEDVDLAVQDPAAERDLLLLARVLVDQLLQILVGERCEVGQRFHLRLSSGSLDEPSRRVNLNFSLACVERRRRLVRRSPSPAVSPSDPERESQRSRRSALHPPGSPPRACACSAASSSEIAGVAPSA